MSSDLPSDAPSRAEAPSTPGLEPGLASLIRVRGAVLLEGLDSHLPGSREHADAVASYAFAAAVELGLDRDHAEVVREVAKLHDVGAVYVPAGLLAKPSDRLTGPERAQLDARFEDAYQLAAGAGLPEDVCEWIRACGERYDGLGPRRARDDAIPLESRIARAACLCDELLAAPGPGGDLAARRRRAIEGLRRAARRELDPRVA